MMQYQYQQQEACASDSSQTPRAPSTSSSTQLAHQPAHTARPQPREISQEILDVKTNGDLNHRNILNIIGLYDSEALFSKQYYSLLLAGGTSSVSPNPSDNTKGNESGLNEDKLNIAIDIAKMAAFLHHPSNPNKAQQALITEVQEAQKAGRFAKEAGTTWLKYIFGNDPKAFKLAEYIAPELHANPKASNEPADVYAFAFMLKTLLKGQVLSSTVAELINKCSAKQPADRPNFEHCLDTLLLEVNPAPKDSSRPPPASEFLLPSSNFDSLPSGVPLSQPAPKSSYKKKIDIDALGLVGGTISSTLSQQPSNEQQIREEKKREIEKLRQQDRESKDDKLASRMKVLAVSDAENAVRDQLIREREEQKRREEEERRRREEAERIQREEEQRKKQADEARRLMLEQERARVQRQQWEDEQQRRNADWQQQRASIIRDKRSRMCPANIHSKGQYCSIVGGIWRG